MDWNLIWQFASVVAVFSGMLGSGLWWIISSQNAAQSREFAAAIALANSSGSEYSHALESRVHANETDIGQFKERLGIMEVRQDQAKELKTSLEKFADKLDGVAIKLEVVADRLDRVTSARAGG